MLHGFVYCGECGHKMVVQYKNGTRYMCNYLRQQYHVPVCQRIPADPIDIWVVNAFFDALSPLELNLYQRAVHQWQHQAEQVEQARQHHLQRLRYQATLAQRQFDQVDPQNRLVAADLERRWEEALRELKQAEDSYTLLKQQPTIPSLPSELQEMFLSIGQRLPDVWQTPLLSNAQKKALLRCVIDKVVIHRCARDLVRTRIVWQGGATTTTDIPIPVGSYAELSGAKEMEAEILTLASQGIPDEEIAQRLTDRGHRSPKAMSVLPNTVRTIRLRHRILQTPHQSHPRQIPGYLTVSQIVQQLRVSAHWIYDRIHNGSIQIAKDPHTRGYLFPDEPATLDQLRCLKQGTIATVQFAPREPPPPTESVARRQERV